MKLLKCKEQDVMVNDIFDMIEDILRFLEKEEVEEYDTNQIMVGMRSLFRGYVVKVWKGSDFSIRKYHHLNKILAKHCMNYCKKC